MKVIEIRDKFGVDSLQLVERPDRVPGPGQVVLKMKAFSINYRDLLVVNGVGRWKPPLGRVPLSDGVGIVAATGNDVSRVKVGDRVAPIFYPKWLDGRVAAGKMRQALGGAAADGVLAEYTLFDEASLVHVPAHLTDEEAATLPCAGVTAWSALIPFGNISPGNSVVVLGTGGVSIFALQFAKFLGARVIVTSSSDQKRARAKKLGAAAVINYKAEPDWPKAVVELTDGLGADYVVDTVGGLKEAIAAVRLGGTVAFVGLLIGTSGDGVHVNWPDRFFAKIVDSFLTKAGNNGARVGNAMTYILSARELLDFALPLMKAVVADPLAAKFLKERSGHS